MRATSRPGPTVQAGHRICWRCGIEFAAHARLAPGAPCRDCREFLKRETKTKEREMKKNTDNENARLVGLLILAIHDGDKVAEVGLMRDLTAQVGAMGMLESMASVAIESMRQYAGPENWRAAMLTTINALDDEAA